MTIWLVGVEDANATDTNLSKTISTTTKTVTAATKANPCQVTMTGHTMVSGDKVSFASVGGMTQLNGNTYTVTYVDANNITIGVDSTGYGTYTSGGTGTILGTTQTNPLRVHMIGHGMSIGQDIYISSVAGMTQLNGTVYQVSAVPSVDTVEININATGYSVYSSGGTAAMAWKQITNITQANPAVVTSSSHGRSNGARVYISDVGGMTEVNGKTYTVANATTDTFELSGINSTGFTAYTTGGTLNWIKSTLAGTHSNPICVAGDSIYVEKTGAASSILGGVTFGWTRNLNTVSTSSTTVGTINIGDIIGPSTATGNGGSVPYNKVTNVSSTTITLLCKAFLGDGVGSISEAGCKRIVPVAEGLTGAAILNQTKDITTIGGYTFTDNTAPTRNGETWLKHAFADSATTNTGINPSLGSVSYINLSDCYQNFIVSGTGTSLTYFSSVASYYRSVSWSATNGVINNYCLNGADGSIGYEVFYISSSVDLSATGYSISQNASSEGAYSLNATNIVVQNGNARCSPYGYRLSSSNMRVENGSSDYCSIGYIVFTSGSGSRAIINCTAQNGTTGVYVGTLVLDTLVKGCTFTTMASYGVYVTQSFNTFVKENTFTNCNYGVYQDIYSAATNLIGNTHVTPTTFAVAQATSSGSVTVIGDTIDNASRYKALSVASYTNYMIPQYFLQNAFGITGTLYYLLSKVRVAGASPYTEITHSAARSIVSQFPMKVYSMFVKTGTAKEIVYELNCTAAISGLNLTPVVTLNGVIIQTEAAITSVSTGSTWDDYTITVAGGSVTEDGELAIEWLYETTGGGTIRHRVTSVT